MPNVYVPFLAPISLFFSGFPDFSGISGFVPFLFLGLRAPPTGNIPERVRDTSRNFPQERGNPPIYLVPICSNAFSGRTGNLTLAMPAKIASDCKSSILVQLSTAVKNAPNPKFVQNLCWRLYFEGSSQCGLEFVKNCPKISVFQQILTNSSPLDWNPQKHAPANFGHFWGSVCL